MNGVDSKLPPPQWRPLARLVLFLLGVAAIVDALTASTQQVAELITGLVLVGLVPVDEFVAAVSQRLTRRDPG